MKKTLTLLSLTVAALAQPLSAHADIAFNAGAVSEYRYRGLSQTRLQPAVQAGVDFSDGGFYLGAWSSTIRWIKDAGGDAPLEFDFYGGHKGEIVPGLGYDVGVLRYQYPSARLPVSPSTRRGTAAGVTEGSVPAAWSSSRATVSRRVSRRAGLTRTASKPASRQAGSLCSPGAAR